MNADQTTREAATWLTALAQQPSFTAAPVLPTVDHWERWAPRALAHHLHEGAHTIASEVVCDLGEYTMRDRKSAQRGGNALRRAASLLAVIGLAALLRARKVARS